MIGIIDYGMGNLRSVQKAFQYLGYEAIVTDKAEELRNSSALVLPGVGAFYHAMENLHQLGLVELIREWVLADKPFLGICLGVQLLFDKSFEDGEHAGLGVFRGEVVRFPKHLTVPHMGWNQLWQQKEDSMFSGIKDGTYFYFVHSYYVHPHDDSIILGRTDYEDVEFVSMVRQGRVIATQFHPEKSQRWGLKLLKNFAENVAELK